MKPLIAFMAILVFLSSGLALFGFAIYPSFYNTMESFGDLVSSFDIIFSEGILKTIRAVGLFLSDDLAGYYYVLDPDIDNNYLHHIDGFKDAVYLVEFSYRPPKTTSYGSHGFWLNLKSITGSTNNPAIFLAFGEDGEFLRSLVCLNNKVYVMNGIFTTSYYSKYSEIAKITFTEPNFNIVHDIDWRPHQFSCNIFATKIGTFKDFVTKYTSGGKF